MPKVEAGSTEAQYFRDLEAGLAAEGIEVRLQGGYRGDDAANGERPLITRATWRDPLTGEAVHTRKLRLAHPHKLANEQVYGRLIRDGVQLLKSEITKDSVPVEVE